MRTTRSRMSGSLGRRGAGRWGGRFAAVLVVVLLVTLASPGANTSRFGPVHVHWSRLLGWLTAAPGWALPPSPATPRQESGSASGKGHYVSADATRARRGAGGPAGTGAGQVPEYKTLAPNPPKLTTPPATGVFDPATSRRIATESTATQDIYQNADGSYTRQVHGAPINYKAADGSYQPIDTHLVRNADGRLHEKANVPAVDLAGTGSDPALVSVPLDAAHSVAFGLYGAAAVTPTVSGNITTYPSVLPDTDLVEQAVAAGLKESIVLHSVAAGNSWVFPLRLQGLTARINTDGGVDLVDSAGTVRGAIPHALMQDSNVDPRSGNAAESGDVTYQLTTVDDAPALRVTADQAWLNDPHRVYPVVVDPSANFDATVTDYAQTGNGTDHSGEATIRAGTWDGGTDKATSYLAFSGFATSFAGDKATAVSLHIFDVWAYTCTAKPFNVAAVTQSWSTSTVTGYPGPSYGSSIGSVTANPGSACTNTSVNPEVGTWMTVSLSTSTFVNWVTGASPNYGLAVYASATDSTQWKKFDGYNTDKDPYLAVTYTPDVPPQVTAVYPPNSYNATSLTPELAAAATDSDAFPKPITYTFTIFDASTGTQLATSGAISSADWVVPSGKLAWSKNYYWTVSTYDGYSHSATVLSYLNTPVPQPLVTSGLSQSSDGPGFDPSIGDYTASATDAQVATVGPELAVDRDYNSRDPRTGGAFGAGWSSLFDAQATELPAGAPQTVVVTYPDGSEVGYGRNADGSYSPPQGRFATFAPVTGGGYSLTDKNDTVYKFTQSLGNGEYGITSVTDANGHVETFGYTGAAVTTVTSASGRALHLTWFTPTGAASPHVATVATDPTTSGDPTSVLTWTYSYSADALTKVCPPTSTTACTTYGYTTGTQYPSAALDAGPRSYWRLGDAAGATTAADSAPAQENSDPAPLHSVTLGVPGGLAGSTATAGSFNGTGSYLTLPNGLATGRIYQTLSLWFSTTSPNGVLFSYQKDSITNASTAGNYVPALYVGTDGKLLGEFWPTTRVISAGVVTDGAWHHVVLAGAGTSTTMWLDGALVGTGTGTITPPQDLGMNNDYIGAGFVGGTWPDEPHQNATAVPMYFNGAISDVAFYDRPLSSAEASVISKAGHRAASPLATVTRPSGRTYAQVVYSAVTGLVTQVTDDNGGIWKLGAPAVAGSSAAYVGSVLGTGPKDYWRLDDSGASAVSTVKAPDGTYSSVTLGATGAFGTGDDAAASFNGTSSSLQLPTSTMSVSGAMSAELWFNATTGDGVLFSSQLDPITASTTTQYNPDIYLGTDGKLRAEFWGSGGGSAPMTTAGSVTDGKWHQAVLTTTGTAQVLYLDGAQVATKTLTNTAQGGYQYLGAGFIGGSWPGSSKTGGAVAVSPFKGTLDDFSFYTHTLSATDVADHYAAFKSSAGVAPTQTVVVTDPGNKNVTYKYDVLNGNRIVSQTNALGQTTRYGYDSAGYQATVTDPNGVVTTTGHDMRGNTVSTTTCQDQAAGRCATFYYTYYPNDTAMTLTPDPRNDQMLTMRDPRSSGPTDNTYLTSYGYDATGNLTTVTTPPVAGSPSGRVTTTAYTDGTTVAAVDTGFAPAGLPRTQTTPGGAVTLMRYFHNGDLAQITDADGQMTSYAYDGVGRVLAKTITFNSKADGTGTASTLTSSYGYDGLGQVTSRTDPAVTDRVTGAVHTPVTANGYDTDGNLTSQTVADATGGDASRTTTATYNGFGQQATQTDAAGDTFSYGYDAYGNRTTVTDPAGNETDYAFDADANLLTTTLRRFTGDPANPSAPADAVLSSHAYDPAGRLASVTDAMGFVTSYTYTDDGLLGAVTRTDPAHGTSFVNETDTYDAAGNLVTRVSNNGFTTTTFTVDAASRTTLAVLDPTGVNRSTTYVYSPDDRVTKQTVTGAGGASTTDATFDPAGNMASRTVENGTSGNLTTTWSLDQRGLPTSMTDPNGNTTNYAYDEGGQLAVTIAPTVNTEVGGGAPVATRPVTMTGYDTFGDQVESSDADGNTTTYAYDAAGRLLSTTLPGYTPAGSSTPITAVASRGYDKLGEVVSETDPLGRVSTRAYDQLGRLATTTAPNTGVSHYTYDLNDDQLSATDPTGAQTQATYDWLGRTLTSTQLVRQPTPAAYTTTYGYAAQAGWLNSTITPDGSVTSMVANAVGETTSTTDGAGNTTSYRYDYAGRRVATVLPDGTSTTVTYDPAGRAVGNASLDAAGATLLTTSAGYDSAGNLVTSTDARGNTITFGYDASGLLTSQVQPVADAKTITTSFGYDAAGNRTRFTDGRGNRFLTTYNTWNLPESQIEPATAAYSSPANSTFTTAYDADGDPVTESAPGGVSVSNTYDTVGNLAGQTGIGADAPTAGRTFGHDLAGRLTSVSAPAGTDTFTLDDRGLLLSATGPSGSSSFAYNGDGLLSSRTDAAGTTGYTYDPADRLATVADASTGTQLTYTYNALSQPNHVTYGSLGDTRTFGYDSLHRLASDTVNTAGGATIASITYGYDNNSNLTSKTTTGYAGSAANTYTYDFANRLTSWNNGTATISYGYDDSGNRTQIGAQTYAYDARDQLTSGGGSTYSYTARGTLSSVTTGGTTTNATSDAYGDQLTQGTQSYAYDGLGRVVTASGAASYHFAYSGSGATLAGDGSATYSYDPDGNLTGVKAGATGVLAVTDQHDDVVGQFTSTASALSGSRAYDPLGNVLGGTGMVGNLGYQSGWTDPATTRVNMAARWYTPGLGQFTSRDQVAQDPVPNPAAANPFAYVGDNPLDGTDPTGHWGIGSLWHAATHAVSSAYHAVTHAVSTAWNFVASTAHSFYDDAISIGKRIWHAATTVVAKVAHVVKKVYHYAQHAVYQVVTHIRHAATAIRHAVVRTVHRVVTVVHHATEVVAKKVADAYHKTIAKVNAVSHAAVKWAENHAELVGAIAGAVAGAVVGGACIIGTWGVGTAGCMVLGAMAAGAVNGAVTHGLQVASGKASGGLGGWLGAITEGSYNSVKSLALTPVDAIMQGKNLVTDIAHGNWKGAAFAGVGLGMDVATMAGAGVRGGAGISAEVEDSLAGARGSGGDFVDLYHGTGRSGADAIRSNGIDLSVQRPDSDFGRGFYTTRDADQAAEWAGRKPGGGAVLHYRMPVDELAKLRTLKFPTADADWENFVLHNRSFGPLHDYDAVDGPMLLNPDHALDGKPIVAGGDQLSFHSDRAVSMLNRYLMP